jgi:hypothetical protein
MMKRLILGASMMVATPAAAERFFVVDMDLRARVMVAINLDSLRQINGNWRAWTFVATQTNLRAEPAYSQSLDEFDCGTERYRAIVTKEYNAKGVMTGDESDSPWRYPAPDSNGYAAMQVACGKVVADRSLIYDQTPLGLFGVFQNGLRRMAGK